MDVHRKVKTRFHNGMEVILITCIWSTQYNIMHLVHDGEGEIHTE